MDIKEIITKKKNKEKLAYEELSYAFNGYLEGIIPDYQMSSLLMAITINGMTLEETIDLTDIFIKSGEVYDLSSIPYTVDKHSTGGVGDTTTLIVGPMCAALGLHMVKMSGRGLGLTGGTIDKLESIPGFKVGLSKEEFIEKSKCGFVLSSQTETIVPMDKKIYALRDVTGTTESIPLIASSIMSKKIAMGAENILIDVKYGNGALMKTLNDAKVLSKWLIDIGNHFNKNVDTILTDTNMPLSYAIGNALEVKEAIDVLDGKSSPLRDISIEVVSKLLNMSKGIDFDEGIKMCNEVLNNKSALNKFYEFVSNQDGKIDELQLSDRMINIRSNKKGYVKNVDAHKVALLACKLGANKMDLNDVIDNGVGILLHKKKNDSVEINDLLFTLYVKEDYKCDKSDFKFISISDIIE